MPAPSNIPWADLFVSKTPADSTLELRAIKKSGRPFLFVPSSPSLAARSLALYSAQTGYAKLAKSVLRAALQTGLPLRLEKTAVELSSTDPFPAFLASLIDHHPKFPSLAILSGNPNAAGSRHVILLFDEKHRPAYVVKAGLGDSARQLIRHEAAFLHSAPPGTPGIPLLRASFDTGDISAFALNYFGGVSPGLEAWPELARLSSSWVNREKQIQIQNTRAWVALQQTCSANAIFARLAQKLADAQFHPVISHGDFAPWNIKVSPQSGTWIVLDWERGDLAGIPAWDWFHYVIQSAVLVAKQSVTQLLDQIEQLLASAVFQTYASESGIAGQERLLLIVYLFHLTEVIRPSEGLETNRAFRALLCQRWLS